jgi:hypothetical protein
MGRRKQQKPFFYFEDLKDSDKVAIGLYAIFTAVLILIFLFANALIKQITLIGYIVLPQIFIYLFLYASLRNMTSYSIWFAFGLLNLIFYFIFRNDSDLQMARGNPSIALMNLLVLLWVFQILRYFSLKIQSREFFAVSRNGMDLVENKEISSYDHLIGVIYFGSWIGLTMLSLM